MEGQRSRSQQGRAWRGVGAVEGSLLIPSSSRPKRSRACGSDEGARVFGGTQQWQEVKKSKSNQIAVVHSKEKKF